MNKSYLFALIGYPLGHTLSPVMHMAALNKLKMDGFYTSFEIEPAKFGKVCSILKELPFSGYNVTVPYKEKIIRFLDDVTEDAAAIGAVNTIEISGGKLIGHNTDCYGFLRSLKNDLGISPKGKSVFVLGAGGAARAVVYGLISGGAEKVYLADIDRKRSLGIRRSFKSDIVEVVESNAVVFEKILPTVNLFVNATPVGLKKNDPLLVSPKLFSKKSYVYDLIYNPADTKLLGAAKKRGAKVSNGLGMLLLQGARAFEIWTGKKPPLDIMYRALQANVRVFG